MSATNGNAQEEADNNAVVIEMVPPATEQLSTPKIRTGRPTQDSEDDTAGSFDDTADLLLAQIGTEVEAAEATVSTEMNAAMLDEARHLRAQRDNLANIVNRDLQNLITRTHACRFKRTKYGRILSIMQTMSIALAIALGAFLTVSGIVERELNTTFTGETTITLDSVTPVVTACIAMLGSLITHKKLMEKMETISKAVEKSIYIQAQLPSIIDRVHNCKTLRDFEKLEAEYQGEPRKLLNSCNEQIGQALNLEDSVVNSESIQFYQLRSQSAEANYIVQSESIRVQKEQRLEQLATVRRENTGINSIDSIDSTRVNPITFQEPGSEQRGQDASQMYWDTVGTSTGRQVNGQESCWDRLCPCPRKAPAH
jgi:hypothetical protein